MDQIEPSERHRRILKIADVCLLIGYGLGLLGFAAGMMTGISIDPRADMHGRMVAYSGALSGLVLACFCGLAMAQTEKDRKRLWTYGVGFVAASVLAIYQLGQTYGC